MINIDIRIRSYNEDKFSNPAIDHSGYQPQFLQDFQKTHGGQNQGYTGGFHQSRQERGKGVADREQPKLL